MAVRGDSLAIGARPGNVINGNADAEHAVVTGPAIDAAVVVADLRPLPGLVNGRYQVQADRPGDTRENDVADFGLSALAGRWPAASLTAIGEVAH